KSGVWRSRSRTSLEPSGAPASACVTEGSARSRGESDMALLVQPKGRDRLILQSILALERRGRPRGRVACVGSPACPPPRRRLLPIPGLGRGDHSGAALRRTAGGGIPPGGLSRRHNGSA